MTKTEYAVTGMTCGHCERSIRDEVGQIAGVTGIEVDAATGRLVVTTDAAVSEGAAPAVSDEAVFAAVEEAGYSAQRV